MSWRDPQRVLVPVDFSKQALAAVDEALAHVSAGEVHVVHVMHPLPTATPGVVWGEVDDGTRTAHVMKALKESLGADRGLHFHVVVDDPGHGIARVADELGADLIIMPSHGRTGLSRLLLGSVAERVLRLAHCPVLVIRSAAPPA